MPLQKIHNSREEILRNLLKFLIYKKIPEALENAEVILLYKKRNRNNRNLRPNSLLFHLYKLFTKMVTNGLTQKMDIYQSTEQARLTEASVHVHTVHSIIYIMQVTTIDKDIKSSRLPMKRGVRQGDTVTKLFTLVL